MSTISQKGHLPTWYTIWMLLDLFCKTFRLNLLFSPEVLCFQQGLHNFGEPFFCVMHEGETLAEIKVRIQRKLKVPDEEFAKVNCFVRGIYVSHFQ